MTQVKCDALLIFGKNDPWCTPAFAKRMYQSLQNRHDGKSSHDVPVHRYVELDNVGHCPNHEAPQAVGSIASCWISANKRQRQNLSLLEADDNEKNGNIQVFTEPWGNILAREITDQEVKLSLTEKIITSLV